MNAKVPPVPMELPVWMRSMSTTASAHLATIIHIVKMVNIMFFMKYSTTYQILEIDECESNPCSNGGTCINEINGYHCICVFGYNYTHCQNGNDWFWGQTCYVRVDIFKRLMNVKAVLAQMVEHVWMKSMNTIASAHLDTIIHIVKMV